MTEPVYDDFNIGEAFRAFANAEVRSYCHDVFCTRPEHPADEEHTDAFGFKYRDGEPCVHMDPPSPRTIGGAPREDPA